jgi:CheY-like chemotaxis protein
MSAPAKDPIALPAAPGQPTVLVVDDSADERELHSYVLRTAGYRVLEPNGAEQAQRLAGEGGRIDVLVTDFNMPGLNGVELARWFRRWLPLSKVLLVSGAPWRLEAHLEATGWPPFLDKMKAFTRLAGSVAKLLAETTSLLPGFGTAELTQRASA